MSFKVGDTIKEWKEAGSNYRSRKGVIVGIHILSGSYNGIPDLTTYETTIDEYVNTYKEFLIPCKSLLTEKKWFLRK